MTDFLLEIGCENIPASFIPPAVEQLKRRVAERFAELRLAYDDIYASGTPRRLTLLVTGLAAAQKSKVDIITGPPVSKSFDEHGSPTRAAAGFAKSHGISVDKLGSIRTEKGEYLGFKKREKGKRTASVLKHMLPELIAELKFPKTMRWEGEAFRFARPVRWMVCLHGESIVRFSLAGVTSGNTSYYMPWIDAKKIRIPDAASYLQIMSQAGIIVDQDERLQLIDQLSRQTAKRHGLHLVDNPGLLQELTFMIEKPDVFVGSFSDKYLSLPHEVVVTAMKAHQRYFALREDGGALVPKFLAFSEGKLDDAGRIKRGNEKVLKARLEDAYFYWQEDIKRGIEGLSQMLRHIVFIEKLGTLQDKSARLHKLMNVLNESGTTAREFPQDKIERISILAKADLASEMVKDGKEFTLLQGLIGSHYASAAGEDPDIVQAIKEQYLP
ncbi:MAG: glycine--tRNA ligase subunit beta, partial [Candidatus Latescibacterota bacterium]